MRKEVKIIVGLVSLLEKEFATKKRYNQINIYIERMLKSFER